VTPDFLSAIHASLQKGGSIYVATDEVDYFEIIKEVAESDRRFAISGGDVDLPLSRFGLIFRQKGASIHWLELRKISPVK
jgi:tRNA G46 methylase TrmB